MTNFLSEITELGGATLYDTISGNRVSREELGFGEESGHMDKELQLFLDRQIAFFEMPAELRMSRLPPRPE